MDINEIKKIVEQIRAKYCRTDEMAKKPQMGGTQMATPSGGSTGGSTTMATNNAPTHNYTRSNSAPRTPGGTGPKTTMNSNNGVSTTRNKTGTNVYHKSGRRTGHIKTNRGSRTHNYSTRGGTTHNYTNH